MPRLAVMLALLLLLPACGEESPSPATEGARAGATTSVSHPSPQVEAPEPVAAFVQKGLDWLLAAQHEDGGWGAGSHARQQIRDPKAVQTDPATTAFVGLALLRAGGSPGEAPYGPALTKATTYLVTSVETTPREAKTITTLTGTQPQTKLGPHIDTAIATQFFSRVLPLLEQGSGLHDRVNAALDACIGKLQDTQHADGTWGKRGGWAPVLQASMGGNALEMAQRAGKAIDALSLKRARDYQQGNLAGGGSGRAATFEAAGVELYSFAGAGRAMAPRASRARQVLREAAADGRLPEGAPMTAENLRKAGLAREQAEVLADAASKIASQNERLANDEELLRGFGSNGGEEYLSYLLQSESLVIAGGKPWEDWNAKMHARLAKIQSADGSWTGHHCITSPVFCTAAVVQTLTAERDAAMLRSVAAEDEAAAPR